VNQTNLDMVRGNTFSFDILIEENDVPVNLTGGSLKMMAKWSPLDADASAVFTKSSPSTGITVLSAVGGTANITIAPTDTNIAAIPYHDVNLYYDIRFTDGSGNVFTVMRGNLLVQYIITRA
jgi:hypothetical protein